MGAKCLCDIISSNSHNKSTSQLRILTHTGVKTLAQGHTASKPQNLPPLKPDSTPLTAKLPPLV